MFIGIICQNDGEISAEKLESTNLEDARKEFADSCTNDEYDYDTWDIFVDDMYQNLEQHVEVVELV